jgi:hypothetical protein
MAPALGYSTRPESALPWEHVPERNKRLMIEVANSIMAKWFPEHRAVVEASFVCPRCGARSYNPHDIEHGYCGECHWWTGDVQLGSAAVLAQAERDGAIRPVNHVG